MATDAQIEAFHRDGFLALERLIDQEEVARLREIYDRLFASRVGYEKGDRFDLAGTDEADQEALPQLLGPSNYAPELKDGPTYAAVDALVKQLLGPTAWSGGDHAILKPARHGSETPWHQDEAYWDPSLDYTSVSVWIPLQDATPENGCLCFVPGSHRLEVMEHRSIGGDRRIHGLEAVLPDVSRAVACPIPAGGCTVHLSRTLHYAGPNRTDHPRRALIIGGGVEATKRTDNRRFPWNEAKETARQARADDSASRD